MGGLIFDSKGNLYGTTVVGSGIFQLSPPGSSAKTWTLNVLANIDGVYFGVPFIVRGGNLYGESNVGNAGSCSLSSPPPGCGYVFQLGPPAAGTGPWTKTVLYAFTGGADGANPYALISDTNGNLYGLGSLLGSDVFELSPPSNGTGSWTETVLINQLFVVFSAVHGTPIRDSQGNFYINTYGQDGIGPGFISRWSPPPGGTGQWIETHLYDFTGGADGGEPNGAMIFDTQGNLYGTTGGGGKGGVGVIYELSPPASGSGSWTEKVLYSFNGGADGAYPIDRLIFDSQGNLYGTASEAGDAAGSCQGTNPPGCGVVFRLSPPSSGTGPWTETVLYTFTGGSDGGEPGGVIFDSSGNLYGTAAVGGNSSGHGVVFELIPSS